MSEIHFDQEGEPNEPHPSCTEIRWRYFPNPGTRGAPRIVHDKRNGGAPLYTPVDVSYVELRDLVDSVAGYYRGDQVDQARRLIPSVKPFYVTIAAMPRNATGGGAADDLLGLLRHFADANTRQSETLVNQVAAVMREQRKTLRETRKVMRVVATADLREVLAKYAATMNAPSDEDDDDDDDEEETEDEDASAGVLGDIKDLTTQVVSAFETWMLDRQAQRAEAAKARTAQPTPAPEPVPAPSPPAASPESTTPPPSPPAPPPAAPIPPPASSAPTAPPAAPTPPPTSSAPATSEPAASAETRNAGSPVPTPEQSAHLMAILHRLQPSERTIARAAVHRMPSDQRAHWLAELSRLTVDQAVELVRSTIETRTKKESES